MDRPMFNFASEAPEPANSSRERRTVTPTAKVRQQKEMEAEQAANRAKKAAAVKKRKPTKAFSNNQPVIGQATQSISPLTVHQKAYSLPTMPANHSNNRGPLNEAVSQHWYNNNGTGAGNPNFHQYGGFNALPQMQVPAPVSSRSPQMAQPFPFMNISEDQLARLGAMFAQNHWSNANMTQDNVAGVGGTASTPTMPGPSNTGMAMFSAAEMQEIEDDLDANANVDESEETQQMRSVANDEQSFTANSVNGQLGMLSQSGKTTSFDFQFPQPDINATPQAPQALSLPVPNVMQGNTVAGNDIMGSDDELDDDDDDDADDDDEETNGSTKAAKGKKRKGFNGLELDAMQRRVGKLACKLYALHIASEDAWLDDPTGEANASQPVSTAGDRREQVAVQKWFTARGAVESCTGLDLSETKPTGEEITLVKNRDSWMRGRFKRGAKLGVVGQYDFKVKPDGKGRDAAATLIIYNREKVEKLKNENSYVFRDPTNVNEPQSIYRNALIEEVIVHALFNNDAKSIGALAGSAFGNLMPLPTIALAATAIECAIDEFYKGVRKTMKFKGSTYCKIYRHHLRQLSNWNEHQPESLAVFQSSLMADVKSAAGIDNDVDAASIEQRADVPLSRFS